MKTQKQIRWLKLTIASVMIFLFAGNIKAQILKVDSVSVDSVWNSDSSWHYSDGTLQQRISRDCRISFIPEGEGLARMFIALSIDSAKTWAQSPNPMTVINNALSSTFKTGEKVSITVRINGGDKPGVAFRITARQAALKITADKKSTVVGLTQTPTTGQIMSVPLNINVTMDTLKYGNGYCPMAKICWDVFGDGVIDDSTSGANALSWLWKLQVPAGGSAQSRFVVASAIDKNGLASAPETLTVQCGLHRTISMKDIPGGTFSMGDSSITDTVDAVHQVTLSSFKIQETEVTQEQYLAVMDSNPSLFKGDLLRPVDSVTWYNAAQFCNALSTLIGLDIVYNTNTLEADFTRNGYRLPTEAQWEYACRGGSETIYWWGPDTTGMRDRSWSLFNSKTSTQPVATRLANAWGLYDMAGNVWEWCNDWYAPLSGSAQVDPIGPAIGTHRMTRGGSWWDVEWYLRSACRGLRPKPDVTHKYIGFRIALPAK